MSDNNFGLKGMAYTVPILGRIAIGHIEERNDKRLPAKDDFISITAQTKRDGAWVPHPIEATVKKEGAKLRAIPVRVMFDDTSLNLRERYEAFKDNRQVCVGDGEKAKRRTPDGVIECECPGSESCDFGAKNRCKAFGRFIVQIEGQEDPFAAFIFRTRGTNSVRSLRSRIEGLKASLGRIAGLPMTLVMKEKASAMSMGTPFYYLDLIFRKPGLEGVAEAIEARDALEKALEKVNFNRAAYEAAVAAGLSNSAFEETIEDAAEFEDLLLASPDMDDERNEGVLKGLSMITGGQKAA